MRHTGAATFLGCLLIAGSALSAETSYSVLIDRDNSPTTGCSVELPARISGIEQVLITTVDEATATVRRVVLERCIAGAWTASLTVDSKGWPLGVRADGSGIIETRLPLNELGEPVETAMRLRFMASHGLTNAFLFQQAGGGPILFPTPGRSRTIGHPILRQEITLDGNEDDWSGVRPLARAGDQDPVPLKLTEVSVVAGMTDLYFCIESFIGPVAVDDEYTVRQGRSIAVGAPGVLFNDVDPLETGLTVSVVRAPGFGVLSSSPTGSFLYTSAKDSPPVDSFAYTTSDGIRISNVGTVTIDVIPNSQPVAHSDEYSVGRGLTLQMRTPGVLANDMDPDGDALTARVSRAPEHGAVSLSVDGSFTYVHDDSETLADSFSYLADDGVGESTATVTLKVLQRNHPPSFDMASDLTVVDTSGSLAFASWATSISAGPFDEARQALTFSAVNDHNELFAEQPAISASGTLTFATVSGQTGDAFVTVTLHDDGGTANGGSGTSLPRRFRISVESAPLITVPATATFSPATAENRLDVASTGRPAASIVSVTRLPAGLTLTDHGDGTATLSGRPLEDAGRTIRIAFLAANRHGSSSADALLTVTGQAPSITTAAKATLWTFKTSSFTIRATGLPAPALSCSGDLPKGIIFHDNGDGTATLSGTAAAGTGGLHAIRLVASNGVGADATQDLTAVVNELPSVSIPVWPKFTVGQFSSFVINVRGYPRPYVGARISWMNNLGMQWPSGICICDHGGTVKLEGTPAIGTGGYYGNKVFITATNDFATAETASGIEIMETPVFLSGNQATFVIGRRGTFTIELGGYGNFGGINLAAGTVLPTGLNFDGWIIKFPAPQAPSRVWGAISGTPAAGTSGVYRFNLGVNQSTVTQAFTLTIVPPPAP
jgi:VCBS repeat-containing protein